MTAEQILEQVDSMRAMILQAHGGGHLAYEQIRANDPLRFSPSSTQVQFTPVPS